jgi:NAD(P)-dependent dehydrogenase (short-subunit alcohol dehydrogenase family)
LDVVKDEGMVGKLFRQVILITGASAGIGVETARALHVTGAHLYLTTRDMKKGQKVVDAILAEKVPTGGKVELLQLKLDDLQSVRECAADFLRRSKQLNILILNAGVMACPEGRTKDGFETQFGTNHLGHFLLFEMLKETLLASSTPAFNSRVVSLSSGGHRMSPIVFDDLDLSKGGYDPWKAYGQSKTANIYLANEIERRYGPQGLHATSVMPGGIFTELGRHLATTDPSFFERLMKDDAVKKALKSPEQGAATTVWAAIGNEWEGKGGNYLEDCKVAPAVDPNKNVPMDPGHADYAYDEAAAQKLWDVSLKLVGLED